MKELPTNNDLNILWAVATSSAIETGTRPHIIFAKLLYNDLNDIKPRVGIGSEN